MSFVPLNDHPDYEIMTEYPFTIRRKDNAFVVSEFVAYDGYILVTLNGKHYRKHRLIALQFIHNDDPIHKTEVDHINHDRSDNHIDNLRWLTPSQNTRNKSSNKGVDYQFVENIPDEAIVVDSYMTRNGDHEFEDYYFYDNVFYYFNGISYRILHVNEAKGGSKFVKALDIDNKQVAIYYSKFKKQYDLI